ncbi:platelet glycoprotein Ib alpha chain [Leptodactylus fuscus]|uniref:platelet glycoprotein Ib alpha chain n=1 Tax=Leptodactylus fuscus TaxID=238119 RepID=UPI003F4E974C
MNFLHHFLFFSLAVVNKVFSKPSCSSEMNHSKNKEETSCINLGLSSLPLKEIPANTAILILSSNNFKSLSTSSLKAFKDLTELDVADNGMTSFEIDLQLKLEELNLANNTLTALPKVSELPTLTTLQLSNNRITTIPANAFTGLKKLTRLELQHNYIQSLDEEVFEDLQAVIHLDLSYNQLTQLPDRLLSNVVNLEKLYLSWNKLTKIPNDFFDGLELTYVYLENNDWRCDCDMMYFKTWLEDNEGTVYEISKDGPTANLKSVVCKNKNKRPLIDYDMDHCLIKGKGDMDINLIPLNTVHSITNEWEPTTMPTTEATTMSPTTTTEATTMSPTTSTEATTMSPTTTSTEATTTLPTTTSTEATTMSPTTTSTEATTTLPTTSTEATTMSPTTTSTEVTTMSPTTTSTEATTTLPTTTTELTTIIESTSLKTSPRTTMRSTTTPMMTTTKKPTTAALKVSATSLTSHLTEIPLSTILPARSSRVAAFGVDWLAKFILEHCCLLHVIIYGLCIFLLLVGMIITTFCLLWIYCCNRDLIEWLPGIRLIRYSLRAPMSDEEILLVNNGAIESHFREQSLAGVTRMLVLESPTRKQEIRYTSAIL